MDEDEGDNVKEKKKLKARTSGEVAKGRSSSCQGAEEGGCRGRQVFFRRKGQRWGNASLVALYDLRHSIQRHLISPRHLEKVAEKEKQLHVQAPITVALSNASAAKQPRQRRSPDDEYSYFFDRKQVEVCGSAPAAPNSYFFGSRKADSLQ